MLSQAWPPTQETQTKQELICLWEKISCNKFQILKLRHWTLSSVHPKTVFNFFLKNRIYCWLVKPWNHVCRWKTPAIRSPTSRTFTSWRTGSVSTSRWSQCRRSATATSSVQQFSAVSSWFSSSSEHWSVLSSYHILSLLTISGRSTPVACLVDAFTRFLT